VGGGVLDGGTVSVGTAVVGAAVVAGVVAAAVGVSVGIVDGRLQASIARTRASVDNKLRNFITSLLWVCSILPNPNISGKRPFGRFPCKTDRADVLRPLDSILLASYFMMG
jgi:hypothetical protein